MAALHVTAYVALGANLGDPITTVRAAIESLRGLAGTRRLAVSSLYRTAPVGLRNQPDFINAVAALEASGTADDLLADLFAIEAAFGRVRSMKNAPRTLDLDLLLFGDKRYDTPGLTLPHPRLTERAFVLVPLAEIAPTLVINGHGPIADLLAKVVGQRIERLPPG
ncbi:MAG: 2-amino-4-hydroxy-6-hydroxymethyldihydropteridine diphosphokinase [Rhodocyclaceae bacterium]|jgi:2-amino-4-hydroxy-6-hydroxymethyldihydropteridine diphosphokinase|nr:2-amino-4-hydroxy-6-hydroxymethyldihydropteridine diphosphokinase [Rhodocyclaceae bacterium]